MIRTLTRLLRARFQRAQKPRRFPTARDMYQIREAMLSAMNDCESSGADRLRQRLYQARAPQELWLLRNDIYQLVSQRHSQSEAAQRINALIPVFEGWVDAKQLLRIK